MLLRKIVSIGHAKAVVIPQQYIDYYKMRGKEIKQVGMEVNKKIILTPIFEPITNQKGGNEI